MGELLSYPRFKGESATGVAMSGGLLYTYASGTTTPKTTYSDADLTTPNANPVVLDSNGEAVVWLDGEYKLILKDSDGVEQWTMDDIVGWASKSTTTSLLYLSSYDSLAAAVTAIGASASTLIIDANDTLGVDVTVPATLSLRPINGYVITTGGNTLTLNGPITGDPSYQWLSGTNVAYASKTQPKLVWFLSLASAVAAIGADETNLIINKSETITSSITIPSNIHLKQGPSGSILTITTPDVLTVNGPICIGSVQWIDSYIGGAVFNNEYVHEINAHWFGISTASADNFAFFDTLSQCAYDSEIGKITIDDGTYIFSNGFRLYNTKLIGSGRESTIIKIASTTTIGGKYDTLYSGNYMVYLLGTYGGIENLTLHGNMDARTGVGQGGIFMIDTAYNTVDNIKFDELGVPYGGASQYGNLAIAMQRLGDTRHLEFNTIKNCYVDDPAWHLGYFVRLLSDIECGATDPATYEVRNNTIKDCYVLGTARNTIEILGVKSKNNLVENVLVDSPASWDIFDCDYGTSGNIIRNCTVKNLRADGPIDPSYDIFSAFISGGYDKRKDGEPYESENWELPQPKDNTFENCTVIDSTITNASVDLLAFRVKYGIGETFINCKTRNLTSAGSIVGGSIDVPDFFGGAPVGGGSPTLRNIIYRNCSFEDVEVGYKTTLNIASIIYGLNISGGNIISSSFGISVRSLCNVNLSINNVIIDSGSNGIYSNYLKDAIISNNIFIAPGRCINMEGGTLPVLATDTSGAIISGNIFNPDGSATDLVYKDTGADEVPGVIFTSNFMRLRGVYYTSANSLVPFVCANNLVEDPADVIYSRSSPSISYGTSAPASAAWTVGDIVINKTMNEAGAGGSKYVEYGWVNIVSGSPGTWVPLRMLTGN